MSERSWNDLTVEEKLLSLAAARLLIEMGAQSGDTSDEMKSMIKEYQRAVSHEMFGQGELGDYMLANTHIAVTDGRERRVGNAGQEDMYLLYTAAGDYWGLGSMLEERSPELYEAYADQDLKIKGGAQGIGDFFLVASGAFMARGALLGAQGMIRFGQFGGKAAGPGVASRIAYGSFGATTGGLIEGLNIAKAIGGVAFSPLKLIGLMSSLTGILPSAIVKGGTMVLRGGQFVLGASFLAGVGGLAYGSYLEGLDPEGGQLADLDAMAIRDAMLGGYQLVGDVTAEGVATVYGAGVLEGGELRDLTTSAYTQQIPEGMDRADLPAQTDAQGQATGGIGLPRFDSTAPNLGFPDPAAEGTEVDDPYLGGIGGFGFQNDYFDAPFGAPRFPQELIEARLKEDPNYLVNLGMGFEGYRVSDFYNLLRNMGETQLVMFEEAAITAGLIDPDTRVSGVNYIPGQKAAHVQSALRAVLGFANAERVPWEIQLQNMVASGEAEANKPKIRDPFQRRAYLQPDLATLDQSSKSAIRQELGREPNAWELRMLADYQRRQHGEQFQAEEQARHQEYLAFGRATEDEDKPDFETAPGTVQNVDYQARFNQFFEGKFGDELDRRKRTQKVADSTGSLMQGLNTAMRGMG